jgi:hypothetical protein
MATDKWCILYIVKIWKINKKGGIVPPNLYIRNRGGIGFSYRPARLHRLAEFIPWNRFLGPIKHLKVRALVSIRPCGIIKYIDTKAKCRHLKELASKGILRKVFIRVFRLEIQYIQSYWYFRFSCFVNCCLSNLRSGSTLPTPSTVWISIQNPYL